MSAKTLTTEQFDAVLGYVAQRAQRPERDRVIFLMSFKAGLRACEIARLRWTDMADAEGTIRADAFEVPNNISKNGKGRRVPMHPDLYEALLALAAVSTVSRGKARVIRSVDNRSDVSANTIQRYIGRVYEQCGLEGCSSHSGRRTFITAAIRSAVLFNCSLRDVQRMAGHSDLSTTQVYIDTSAGADALVASL